MYNKNKTHKSYLSIFFISLGLILLLSAGGLILYNRWDSNRAGKASAQILDSLVASLDDDSLSTEEIIENLGREGTEIEPELESKKKKEGDGVAVITIENADYMGIIEIPSIGIQLPIMYNWSYDNLNTTVCRYSGSCSTNDLVICGHNYDAHFGRLTSLAPGSDIYITTVDSKVYHYSVDTIEVIEPTQVDTMINSGYDLSLFTCTLSGQARCTVRCTRN